nr:hypothetical protein GCM10025732_45990 [Glycomyces mayteni]
MWPGRFWPSITELPSYGSQPERSVASAQAFAFSGASPSSHSMLAKTAACSSSVFAYSLAASLIWVPVS